MAAKGFVINGVVEFPYPMEAALDWALLIGDRVRLLVEGGWCVLPRGVTPRVRKTTRTNLTGAPSEFDRGDQTVLVTYFDHGEVALQIGSSGGRLVPKALKICSPPIASSEADMTVKGTGPEWYTFESGDMARLYEQLLPFNPPTLLRKE